MTFSRNPKKCFCLLSHGCVHHAPSYKYRSLPSRRNEPLNSSGWCFRDLCDFSSPCAAIRWKWQFEACTERERHKICNMTKHKTLKCNLFIHLSLLAFPPPPRSIGDVYSTHLLVILMSFPRSHDTHSYARNIKERKMMKNPHLALSLLNDFHTLERA